MHNPFTLTHVALGVASLLAALTLSNLVVTGWAVAWLSKCFSGGNNFWWRGHDAAPIPWEDQYTIFMEQYDYRPENFAFASSGLGLGVAILGLASIFLGMQRNKVFLAIPAVAALLGLVTFIFGLYGFVWSNNRRHELYQDQCQAWMGWPVTNQKTRFHCTRRQMACDFVRYLGEGFDVATQAQKDAACTSFKTSHTMMVPIAIFSLLMMIVLVLQGVRTWRMGNAKQGRAAKVHDNDDCDEERPSSTFPSTHPPTYDGSSSNYSAPAPEVAGDDMRKGTSAVSSHKV